MSKFKKRGGAQTENRNITVTKQNIRLFEEQ